MRAQKNYTRHAIESRVGIITSLLRLGLLNEELAIISKSDDALISGKNVLLDTVKEATERKYYSYAATAYEYIARIENRLGNHTQSAENYLKASEFYEKSLENIGFDKVRKKVYEKIDYVTAWSLIEKAKLQHKQENHLKAKIFYEKACNVLSSLQTLEYETKYYKAWIILEEAELFSKEENHEQAIGKYQECVKRFNEAIQELRESNKSEKHKLKIDRKNKLQKVADVRIKYCDARVDIESARILSKKGDHIAAADYFAAAASLFRYVCNQFMIEREKINLEGVYYLCRAWESMELAEQYEDPERFLEAANLFNKASKNFIENKLKLLALGNASICQALELGIRFDETFESKEKEILYPKIKTMLRKAATSYQKGGHESIANWALATSTYFDASWHLIQADGEMDLIKKKGLLDTSSNILQSAAELFRNSGYEYKANEITERIDMIKREEKIILSALNTIGNPTISSSTMGLHAPSCPVESSLSPRISEAQRINQESERTNLEKEGHKYKKTITPISDDLEQLGDREQETNQTEKEVGIETQKIICIVHKGPVDGTLYVCPTCKAYYCLTCAYSLKAKGEKCWSCEREINP